MDIIALIAKEKEEQKLTSYEIAKRSGLPIQMVQRLEKSNKEYLSRVAAILKALGYEMDINPVKHKQVELPAKGEHINMTAGTNSAHKQDLVFNAPSPTPLTFNKPWEILAPEPPSARLNTTHYEINQLSDKLPDKWKQRAPVPQLQPTAAALELAKQAQDKALKKGKQH